MQGVSVALISSKCADNFACFPCLELDGGRMQSTSEPEKAQRIIIHNYAVLIAYLLLQSVQILA